MASFEELAQAPTSCAGLPSQSPKAKAGGTAHQVARLPAWRSDKRGVFVPKSWVSAGKWFWQWPVAATWAYLSDCVSHEIELPSGRRLGLVSGGKQITLAAIGQGIGCEADRAKATKNAISRALQSLERHGVIIVHRSGCRGLRIALLDSTRRFKLPNQITPAACVHEARLRQFPELRAVCERAERPVIPGRSELNSGGNGGSRPSGKRADGLAGQADPECPQSSGYSEASMSRDSRTFDDDHPGIPGRSEAERPPSLSDMHIKADNHPSGLAGALPRRNTPVGFSHPGEDEKAERSPRRNREQSKAIRRELISAGADMLDFVVAGVSVPNDQTTEWRAWQDNRRKRMRPTPDGGA